MGLLLAALLAALPFLPALGSGSTLWFRDAGQNHLPNRALASQMLREGHLPLWNPFRGNGQPFMANPNSLVLRPTTPLFMMFPPERAHLPFTLSVMLLAGLAGAGTFALLADTGYSATASLVGAATFALSGAFQSLGQLVNLLEGAAWIPLALFFLNRAFERDWRPWGALSGLALAMVISTGEPVLAASALLAVPMLPGFWRAGPRRLLRAAGACGLVALLVASVQLVPLADLASASARAAPLPAGQAMKWSLPPAALLQAALPSLWGDPTRAGPGAYWGSGLFETSLPFLTSIHIGLPIILLGFAGLARGSRPVVAAGGAALMATLLAVGGHFPFLTAIVMHVPGLAQSRYPAKWALLASLALALLAAAGFDRMISCPQRAGDLPRRLRGLAILLGAGAAAGLVVWISRPMPALSLLRWMLRIPEKLPEEILLSAALPAVGRSAALACLASLALLLAVRARRLPPRWLPPAAALPCLAVLLWGAWGLNPAAPARVVFEPSPLLDSIPMKERAHLRLFGFPRPRGFAYRTPAASEASRFGLPPDSLAWGMRWDTRTLRFTAPYLHGVRAAWDQAGESLLALEPAATFARRLAEGLPAEAAARLLRAASVGWVLAYGDPPGEDLEEMAGLAGESNIPVRLFALADPIPRASLIEASMTVGSPEAALAAIEEGSVDPATTLLLERSAPEPEPPPTTTTPGASPGSAQIVSETPTEVSLQATVPRESWLLLTDSWAPGWEAEIDGAAHPILRAQGAFRAVRVPPGSHEVVFTYRPRSVKAGLAGSVLGLLTAAGLIIAPRLRRAGPAVP